MKSKLIALVGRLNGTIDSPHSKVIGKYITDLAKRIIERGHTVMFDSDTAVAFIKDSAFLKESIDRNCTGVRSGSFYAVSQISDIAIVIGGDGTMMNALKLIHEIPVLGVNLGRLGFITDVPFDYKHDALIDIIEQEKYTIETRSVLEIAETKDRALNDVVISRSSGKILEFNVTIDGEFAYRARADGLIVTTPTGSTAYAVAAGGAIVHPTARVFEIVPMHAQTLSNRALIINDTSKILFTLIGGVADVLVDGSIHSTMSPKDSILIQKSEEDAKIAHPLTDDLTYSYYHTLREKLNWQHLPGTIRNDDQAL